MKVLIITGSRADRNGLEVVRGALANAGHTAVLIYVEPLATGQPALDVCCDAIDTVTDCADGQGYDIALVAGDRYEIVGATLACSLLGLPVAHIAGGDVTLGSADNRYRDAITALAKVHFATNTKALDRLIKLTGDSIFLTGSPALDLIRETPVLGRLETFTALGVKPRKHNLIISVHPNTVSHDPAFEAAAIFHALNDLSNEVEVAALCLGPNADPGSEQVEEIMRDYCDASYGASTFVPDMAPSLYYSCLTHFDAMVGNSSAGLYEAPTFGLPVVNVGDRQRGRSIPDNVFYCPVDAEAIRMQIIIATSLKPKLICENPYGDGHSAPRIVRHLEEFVKSFT